MTKTDPLLSTLDAGRILGVGPDAVRKMVSSGRIIPDETTPSGFKLFRKSTVERVAAEREQQRRNPSSKGGRPPKKKATKVTKKKTTKKGSAKKA